MITQTHLREGDSMKTRFAISVVIAMMLGVAPLARSDPQGENLMSNPASGTEFASNSKCTGQSPCQNITGEVLKIEETYLIRETNGREISMKTTRDSHMKVQPNVGDSIAAQLTSNGEVQSITKLPKVLDRQDIPVPSNTQGNLR
jgi:hypothetical protein